MTRTTEEEKNAFRHSLRDLPMFEQSVVGVILQRIVETEQEQGADAALEMMRQVEDALKGETPQPNLSESAKLR